LIEFTYSGWSTGKASMMAKWPAPNNPCSAPCERRKKRLSGRGRS